MKYRCTTLACVVIISLGLMVCLVGAMRVAAQTDDSSAAVEPTHHIIVLIDNSFGIAEKGGVINVLPQMATDFTQFLIHYARAFYGNKVAIGVVIFAREEATVKLPIEPSVNWDDKQIEQIQPLSCTNVQTNTNECFGTRIVQAISWASDQVASCLEAIQSHCHILLFSDGYFEDPVGYPVDRFEDVQNELARLKALGGRDAIVIPVVYGKYATLTHLQSWQTAGLIQEPVTTMMGVLSRNQLLLYKELLDRLSLTEKITLEMVNESHSWTIYDKKLMPNVSSLTLDMATTKAVVANIAPRPNKRRTDGFEWIPPFGVEPIILESNGEGLVAYRLKEVTSTVAAIFTIEPARQFTNEALTLTARVQMSGGEPLGLQWLEDVTATATDVNGRQSPVTLTYNLTDHGWHGNLSLNQAGIYTLHLNPHPSASWVTAPLIQTAPVTVTIDKERWAYQFDVEPITLDVGNPITFTLYTTRNATSTPLPGNAQVYAVLVPIHITKTQTLSYPLAPQTDLSWRTTTTLTAANVYTAYAEIYQNAEPITQSAEIAVQVRAIPPTATPTPTPLPTVSRSTPVSISALPTITIQLASSLWSIQVDVVLRNMTKDHLSVSPELWQFWTNNYQQKIALTKAADLRYTAIIPRPFWNDVELQAAVDVNGEQVFSRVFIAAWLRQMLLPNAWRGQILLLLIIFLGMIGTVGAALLKMYWSSVTSNGKLSKKPEEGTLRSNLEKNNNPNEDEVESGKSGATPLLPDEGPLEPPKTTDPKVSEEERVACAAGDPNALQAVLSKMNEKTDIGYDRESVKKLGESLADQLREADVDKFPDNNFYTNLVTQARGGEKLALHILLDGLLRIDDKFIASALDIAYREDLNQLMLNNSTLVLKFIDMNGYSNILVNIWKPYVNWSRKFIELDPLKHIGSMWLDTNQNELIKLLAEIINDLEKLDQKYQASHYKNEITLLQGIYTALQTFLQQTSRGSTVKLEMGSLSMAKRSPKSLDHVIKVIGLLTNKSARELVKINHKDKGNPDNEDVLVKLRELFYGAPNSLEIQIIEIIVYKIWLRETI